MDNTFLRNLIDRKDSVRVIITNGFQMTGKILDHNDKAIIVREDTSGMENLVYKHAISTIMPMTR